MSPCSRGGDQTGDVSCDAHAPLLLLDQDAPNTVTYTYRITWSVSAQFPIEIYDLTLYNAAI